VFAIEEVRVDHKNHAYQHPLPCGPDEIVATVTWEKDVLLLPDVGHELGGMHSKVRVSKDTGKLAEALGIHRDQLRQIAFRANSTLRFRGDGEIDDSDSRRLFYVRKPVEGLRRPSAVEVEIFVKFYSAFTKTLTLVGTGIFAKTATIGMVVDFARDNMSSRVGWG
jgi:hypothetical protein